MFPSVPGWRSTYACRLLALLVAACTLSLASQAARPGTSEAAGASKPKPASRDDGSGTGLNQPDDMQQKFYKLDNGVKVQQLVDGTGKPGAKAGDRVLFDYVLRRSNGYFIYACAALPGVCSAAVIFCIF
jgi:hypothetical protein